jgi:hypothetical protein
VNLRSHLFEIYVIGTAGGILQIAGGNWDVSWHVLGLVETFLTLPHSVLYSGVVLSILAAVIGAALSLRRGLEASERRLLTGLQIAFLGGLMQIVAGPLDFWWHDNFGFDPFLMTPTHSLLIVGIMMNGVGMTLGSVRLLRRKLDAQRPDVTLSTKWFKLLVLMALTVFWLDLNGIIYTVTDVSGIAYTFQLGEGFSRQWVSLALMIGVILLAASGTSVLLAAKRIAAFRGAASIVGVLIVAITATVNLGFRASVLGTSGAGPSFAGFIPLYVSFVVGVIAFDMAFSSLQLRAVTLLAGFFLAPFASSLDGWYSFDLWTEFGGAIPLLLVPMWVMGVIAALIVNARTGGFTAERQISSPAT